MYGIREPPVSLDAAIVARHQHVRCIACGFMDSGDLGDDEAGAAFRTSLMVGDQPIGDAALVRHRGVVAGRHDAVLQGDAADWERRKQVLETHQSECCLRQSTG
jgi:hypothetical protein